MTDLSATELWVFSCSADPWPLAFSSWQVLAQHKVNVFSSLALQGSSYTVLEMHYPSEKIDIYFKKNRLQLWRDDFESVSGKYRWHDLNL